MGYAFFCVPFFSTLFTPLIIPLAIFSLFLSNVKTVVIFSFLGQQYLIKGTQ